MSTFKDKYPNQYAYYIRNKDKPEYKDRQQINNKQFKHKIKDQIYDKLGGYICKGCGFTDIRALQIDHINGGGTQETRNKFNRNYYSYYKYLLSLPIDELKSNYQVLCANCNSIKKYENKE
jgi:hypothetical protein